MCATQRRQEMAVPTVRASCPAAVSLDALAIDDLRDDEYGLKGIRSPIGLITPNLGRSGGGRCRRGARDWRQGVP